MIHFSTARVMNSGTITSRPANNHLRRASMADVCPFSRRSWRPGPARAPVQGMRPVRVPGSVPRGRLRPTIRRTWHHRRAGAVAASAFLPPPSRKSVTYQPEPLSWKPAAVTCFSKVLAPQAGHTVSGASDIFCNASLAKPQALHL
jgi:hypothetical protein